MRSSPAAFCLPWILLALVALQAQAQEQPVQDQTAQDQTAQDQTPEDQTPQDQTAQDQTAQDQTPEDQTPQDQTAQDQTPQNQTPQDQSAQDQAVPPPSGNEFSFDEILERLAGWWHRIIAVWNYKLDAAGNITVSKVVLALFLLAFGVWSSRVLSRLFARRVLGRFPLAVGAVAAIQTLTFYFLTLAFFLWALNLVNIPLTVFTFLGGAVAIGVGFGSQNIVNNFMSGLILIMERPIKVGDLIELDGTSGRIEHIGARSTRIRSGDNTHIIVPNSNLLESRVLNWTLSDNVIRTSMDVGVVYGSDIDKVIEGLKQALKESERVLESPEPEILFLEFGDNALVFRALFWTEVRAPLDQKRAQSDVRFRVDALFREAGLVIAFPQRDIHLDTVAPLEVLLRSTGPRSE